MITTFLSPSFPVAAFTVSGTADCSPSEARKIQSQGPYSHFPTIPRPVLEIAMTGTPAAWATDGTVVLDDQLEFRAGDAAGGVDLIDREKRTIRLLRVVEVGGARLRGRETDLDVRLRRRERCSRRIAAWRRRTATAGREEQHTNEADRSTTHHPSTSRNSRHNRTQGMEDTTREPGGPPGLG